MTEPDVSIDNPRIVRGAESRYEIHVDDSGSPAGIAAFVDAPGADGVTEGIFPHTVVGEQFGGKGLASKLVRVALDETIADGHRIVAMCPYVASWVEKHPDYKEHVVEATQAHLRALGIR